MLLIKNPLRRALAKLCSRHIIEAFIILPLFCCQSMVKLFGLLQGQQKSLNHADITTFPNIRTSKTEVPSEPTSWVKISF